MPERSCLNCKFGKPEKQPEGYYCIYPTLILNEIGPDGEPCWYRLSSFASCGYYKPRQTRCEIEKCKWFDKHEGKDFCYYDDDHWVGAICEDFSREDDLQAKDTRNQCVIDGCRFMESFSQICFHKHSQDLLDGKNCEFFEQKEAEMKIEFQGKMYEATEDLSLAVIHEGRSCKDEFDDAVKIFGSTYGYAGIIHATQENFDKLTINMQRYLVQNCHLKEVVEEVKQLPNQWYKGNESKALYYSRVAGDLLVRLKSKDILNIGSILPWSKEKFTPISPPTITEQPEPAERLPEKCVHHNHATHRCIHPPAMEWRNYNDYVYCQHDNYLECPEYSEE